MMNIIDYQELSKEDLTNVCEFLLQSLKESQEQSNEAVKMCNKLLETCAKKDEQITELKSMIEKFIVYKEGF